MRNFIESGATLDVLAPISVISGQLLVIGDLVGCAVTSALAGTTVALRRGGVVEQPKVSAQAWPVGAKVYLDASTSLLTTAAVNAASAANTLIGRAAEPATNPSGVGRVMLSDFVGV